MSKYWLWACIRFNSDVTCYHWTTQRNPAFAWIWSLKVRSLIGWTTLWEPRDSALPQVNAAECMPLILLRKKTCWKLTLRWHNSGSCRRISLYYYCLSRQCRGEAHFTVLFGRFCQPEWQNQILVYVIWDTETHQAIFGLHSLVYLV